MKASVHLTGMGSFRYEEINCTWISFESMF